MGGRHVAIRAPYRRGVIRRPSLWARLRRALGSAR